MRALPHSAPANGSALCRLVGRPAAFCSGIRQSLLRGNRTPLRFFGFSALHVVLALVLVLVIENMSQKNRLREPERERGRGQGHPGFAVQDCPHSRSRGARGQRKFLSAYNSSAKGIYPP
jgi:hypothetical protein